MTPEITRIRCALAAYQVSDGALEVEYAISEYEDATDIDVMPDLIAHIDAQAAEIERLKAVITAGCAHTEEEVHELCTRAGYIKTASCAEEAEIIRVEHAEAVRRILGVKA